MEIVDKKHHQLRRSMPKNPRFEVIPLAAAIASVLIGIDATAQPNQVKPLEEITVTATRRRLDLQEVSQSITILSADDLEKMGATDIKSIINSLSSVSLITSNPHQSSITMRGLSSGTGEWYTDSQVAIYLDEQPMTVASQQVGVRSVDMERIESLQGPQGTFYGSSSQAGTIRYITNKPNHEVFSGHIEASYGLTEGGDDSYDVNGSFNIPLIDDKLAMRVVAYISEDGGYVDNVYGNTLSGNFDNADLVGGVGGVDKNQNRFGTVGGRVAFLWDVNERWAALLSVVGEKTDSNGQWDSDPSLGDYKMTAFADDESDNEWYSTAFTVKGDLGFAEMTATVTHFDRDATYLADNNVYSQYKDRTYKTAYPAYPSRYDTEYSPSMTFNDQHQERDSLEVRFSSLGDGDLQWVAGLFYEDVYDNWYYGTTHENLQDLYSWEAAIEDLAAYNNQGLFLPDASVSYANIFKRTVKQIAVFAEVTYDLSDKFTLRLGSRWSEFDRETYDAYYYPFELGEPENVGAKTDDSIYKMALQYQVDDDVMVYGLYSQGFRLGGKNTGRAVSSNFVREQYKADNLENFELGIKSQWLDNRLRVNAQAFHMVWSDYQYDISSPNHWWEHGIVNAGDAEVTGLEIDVTFQASNNLTIKANALLKDAEFKDILIFSLREEDQPSLANGQPNEDFAGYDVRAGMTMPNSPKYKGSISINYDIQDVFGGDAWVYFNSSYEAESWEDLEVIYDRDKNGLSDPYTVSSLSFGVALPSNLTFTFLVDNVFNQATTNYVDTALNNDADAFDDSRWHNRQNYEQPRSYWLTLRKDF